MSDTRTESIVDAVMSQVEDGELYNKQFSDTRACILPIIESALLAAHAEGARAAQHKAFQLADNWKANSRYADHDAAAIIRDCAAELRTLFMLPTEPAQ